MYELIIKGGTVIDGSGSPAYHCDIAVADGKIAEISRSITAQSEKIINAQGLTVTPGFIDSHSHSDNAVFDCPDMAEKAEQGITTSVAGQCGSTIAPISKSVTVDNACEIPGYGKENEVLKTFGTMADAIKNIPLGSNLMSFVGHGALRKAVVGYENRKPTAEELAKMKELLREAMDSGAVGLSFGLIYTPSCYADTEELIELAKVVSEYNGVVSAHIRNEGFELARSVSEFLTVIKAADVKAVFSHHKSMYEENWGKVNHTLKMIDEAVSEGYDIYCDVYPYEASCTGLTPTIIAKELRDKDNEGVTTLLSDTDVRRTIKEKYLERNSESLHNLLITQCEGHPEYVGMRIDEIARLRGQDDFETAFDLIADSGATAQICNFCIGEDDICTVIKHERSMICTDSSVAKNGKSYHPRLRGTFPRFLGRYVREKNLISLHEAIRKCTSMPATVYGLKSKGLIREGFDADICIFDANRIIDKADYVNCHKRCEGLNYVIIGGKVVVENSVYNGIKNGKFIKVQKGEMVK